MNCDKCDKPVETRDDVTRVEAIAENSPITCYAFMARHIACSPSRAQYICVEPYGIPDERKAYDKRQFPKADVESGEKQWTAAYLQLQAQGTD